MSRIRTVFLVHRPLDALGSFRPSGSDLRSIAPQRINHHAVEVVSDDVAFEDRDEITRFELVLTGPKNSTLIEPNMDTEARAEHTQQGHLYFLPVVGKTSYSNDDIYETAERLIQEHGEYDLLHNNCQKWAIILFNAITDVRGSHRARREERKKRREYEEYRVPAPKNAPRIHEVETDMEVFVKTLTGMTMEIPVEADSTIQELHEILETTYDIPASDQRLIYAGNLLCRLQTLKDYRIQHESTLHIVLQGEPPSLLIFIEHEAGCVLAIRVKATIKVSELKSLLLKEDNTTSLRSNLIFAGEELRESLTLRESGVRDKSLLRLVYTHSNR